MSSLLLKQAATFIVPLQIFFSIFLMLRGHNEPGGGFIGGLMAAAAIILHGMARGPESAKHLLHFAPQTYIGSGVLVAALSGLPALWQHLPYFTGVWGGSIPMLLVGKIKIGTPLFFDVGVYLTVIGVGTLFAFSLEEAD